MGVDIHCHLVKYNSHTNTYIEIKLYKQQKDMFDSIPIFSGRNHNLFQILQNEAGEELFPSHSIRLTSLEEKLRKQIEKAMENGSGYYGFSEVSLADMKLYTIDNPLIVDYNSDEWDFYEKTGKKPMKTNPICWFFEEICTYAKLYDDFDWEFSSLSDYKLIYYFDR